ncbi:hypothetical protein Cgig2_002499 [Carnegiea gigantea]|uniref:Bifunctional inhibitor/plant lipid transfer protein/seed storage helical domain-containing protein n=1 Tax=Carnegiea gigantea TaxID=171969 RepID=A0A9Q1QP39_9CARY|nr:hypothetical protein Cgig2_002499 [Carnegiea gigantea]
MGGPWWLMAVLTAAAVATAAAQGGGAGLPSCASKLVPCAEYLNATKAPPSSCCDPLKETVTNEKACLCSIYKNPAALQSFGINVTQVMGLPKLCGIDVGKDPSALCKAGAQPPSSSSSGSAQSPPAGTGSGSGSGSESTGSKNAAITNKFSRAGLLASLAVFCAYLMVY